MKPLALVSAAAVMLLTGCGIKGPLYLPEQNAKVITRPASDTAPATPAPQATPNAPPTPPAKKPGSSDATPPR